MKKILAIFLVFSISEILLASCGESTSEATGVSPLETAGEFLGETVSEAPDVFVMPNVVGQDYRLVQTDLEDSYGAIVNIEFTYSDDKNPYVVISSDPIAGESLISGQTVYIIASRGASVAVITVPDFIGMEISEAQTTATELGLNVGYILEMQDDRPQGTVIYQSLKVDSPAEKDDSITFYISSGPAGGGSLDPSEIDTEGMDTTKEAEELSESEELNASAELSDENNLANGGNPEPVNVKVFTVDLTDYKQQEAVEVVIAVNDVIQIDTVVVTSTGTFDAYMEGTGTQTVTITINGSIVDTFDMDFS